MWQGLFQLSLFKSVATLICGLGVCYLVALAVADVECKVATPPLNLPGLPSALPPSEPPTTWDGCQTYGSFLGMPANTAPFILGGLAAVAAYLVETAYKDHQAKKEIPRPQRPAPRDE